MTRAFALAVALVLAGCASFVPQAGPEAEPGGNYVALTTPIIAVGDTQEHLPTGYPLHDNDSAVDAYVEVTQRPPEQPLFGRRVVQWALQRHPDEPYIHLGDLLDLSCRIEAKRMGDVFQSTQNAGAILPGNHDGLMFGIFSYGVLDAKLDPNAKNWNRACQRGAAPEDDEYRTANEAFTKRDFIASYIAAQASGRRPKPGLKAPPPAGEHRTSWRNPDPNAFLSAIEAKLLDGIDYADSFLAQRLKLPPAPGATRDVIVIGLDTNQAGALVSAWDTLMGRSPGSMGHVHIDQVDAVSPWVDEAIDHGDIVIFAGHHNWQSLGLPTRTLLRGLMGKLRHPLVYLSGHTHSGFWAVHRALARQPLLELNNSSLSDWPIAYRRISFAYDEGAKRLLVRGELMPHGDEPSSSYADLMAAWEAETCARSGLSIDQIRQHDRDVVKQQRDSRGSLFEWLLSAIPACESCEQPLYKHAQAYQDAMLLAVLQASADVQAGAQLTESPACETCGEPLYEYAQAYEDAMLQTLLQSSEDMKAGAKWPRLMLPAWCGKENFAGCARALMAEKAEDFQGHVSLFRRKAGLVAVVNDYLGRIEEPKAKAYMTCRAVQGAKIDFDLTDEDRTGTRSEAKRRAEQFFRIEASVGME